MHRPGCLTSHYHFANSLKNLSATIQKIGDLFEIHRVQSLLLLRLSILDQTDLTHRVVRLKLMGSHVSQVHVSS